MSHLKILFFTLFLFGCTSTYTEKEFNGYLYLAGDSECKLMKEVEPGIVQCYNDKLLATELRKSIGKKHASLTSPVDDFVVEIIENKHRINLIAAAKGEYVNQPKVIPKKVVKKQETTSTVFGTIIEVISSLGEGLNNHQQSYSLPLNTNQLPNKIRPSQKEIFYKECIGSVVNGQCLGKPKGLPKTCHGKVILGECHGAITDN